MIQFRVHKDWFKNETVAVKGFCFDEENNFHQDETLLTYFSGFDNFDNFIDKVKTANGIFSVIVKHKEQTWAACDKSRVYPLFYSLQNGAFKISDNPYELLPNHLQIDKEAENEYLASSITFGEKTLVKGIFQLQPSFCQIGRASCRERV